MPTEVRYQVAAQPSLPKSDFAKVDDVDAVPYIGERGRSAYREYLGKMAPRAFAVSPNGAWCWAEEGEAPDSRALATCEKKAGQACRLYSVDENVVWHGDPAELERASTIASHAPASASGAVGGTAATAN
jgi:hypothetical protein